MIINGPWEIADISDDPNFGGFENLGVAPVPGGSAGAGAPVGGHNYVIYSGMDESKADAAIAFVNFMASAESQAFIAEELGVLPGNADGYDQLGDNERVAAWKPALEVATPRPWIPEGGLFFAPARRDGDQGPDPGRGRAEVAWTDGQAVQERRGPGVLRRLTRSRSGAGAPAPRPRPTTRRPRQRQECPSLRSPRPRPATDEAARAHPPRSSTATGTRGRWCCRPCWSWRVLVLYPLVQGIFQSFTNLNEANQNDVDLHQDPGRRRGVQAEPEAGRVRRARRTTSTCSPASAAGSGCSSRTRSCGPSSCVVFHFGLGPGPGRAAAAPVQGPKSLPGAAHRALGGARRSSAPSRGSSCSTSASGSSTPRWTASASTRSSGSATAGPPCSPASSPTSGWACPFMMVALLGGLQSINRGPLRGGRAGRRLTVAAVPQRDHARPPPGQPDRDPARHDLDVQHVPGHLLRLRRRAGRRVARSW